MTVSDEAQRLHHDAFVVDSLFTPPPAPIYVERLLAASCDAVNWAVTGKDETTEAALDKIASFYWLRDAMPDQIRVVTSARDLDGEPGDGVLKVLMGFQGAEPLGNHFHYVSIFHALGIRIIQLTYNQENLLGSGCLEPNDRGLTHFGRQVVREMNRLHMVVDLTHVGEQTSLDAIAVAEAPVIFSHSNAKAVRDNPRNLSDRQLRALGENGGVVGLASFSDFVGDTTGGQNPTIDQYIDHISYVADLIGVDHVGIGTDIMETTSGNGVRWNANTRRRYPEICGGMNEHMHNIQGFEVWEDFINVTDAMLRRGFGEDDVRKVIGGNFQRVFQAVLSA